MIGREEIEIDLVDVWYLGIHPSIGCFNARASVGKELSGNGPGSRDRRHPGVTGNRRFDGFNMLLDLVVTFEVNNKHLVFPKAEIMVIEEGKLAINDHGPGDQDDRDRKLKYHQCFA